MKQIDRPGPLPRGCVTKRDWIGIGIAIIAAAAACLIIALTSSAGENQPSAFVVEYPNLPTSQPEIERRARELGDRLFREGCADVHAILNQKPGDPGTLILRVVCRKWRHGTPITAVRSNTEAA